MTNVTISLDEEQARRFAEQARYRGAYIDPRSTTGVILAQIDAQLPKRLPACVYCRHERGVTRRDWPTWESLRDHMVAEHNCSNDPYGEDTAWTDAWNAFRDAGYDVRPWA